MPESPMPFVRSGPEALFRIEPWTQDGSTLSTSMPSGPWLDGGRGEPSVGSLGVLADDVTGYALVATRPTDGWSVSAEITLDVLHPLPATGSIHGSGAVVHRDRVGGLATGVVTDDRGRELARLSQRGRYVRAPGAEALALPFAEPPGSSAVVPWLREGFVGPTPRRVPDVLGNPRGTVHGGISLCLAALHAEALAPPHLDVASVHIVYARGIPVGAELVHRTEVLHQGRGLMVVAVRGEVAERTATLSQVVLQPRDR